MTQTDRDWPLISVITPSYNSAEFIEETIQSVLRQDYPNFEYIVVDGASSDGTVDILRRYADRICFISEPDEGQSDALNKGLRRARGSIFGWLNADDTFAGSHVLSQVAAEFATSPGLGLLYGDYNTIDETGALLGSYRVQEFDLCTNVLTMAVSPVAVFWRHSILAQVGFLDSSLNYAMDYDYWMRISLKAEIRCIHSTVGNFRLHSNSKTTAVAAQFARESLRVLESFFNRTDLPTSVAHMREIAAARTYWRLGLSLCQESQTSYEGLAYCKKAVEEGDLLNSSWDYALSTIIHWAVHGSAWGRRSPLSDPAGYIHSVLDGIQMPTVVFRRFRSKALSGLYASQAFESYAKGNPRQSIQYACLSWLYDPRLLMNTGLVSVCSKSIGRYLVPKIMRPGGAIAYGVVAATPPRQHKSAGRL